MKRVFLIICFILPCFLVYAQQSGKPVNELLVKKLIIKKNITRDQALKIARIIDDISEEINVVYNDTLYTDNLKKNKIEQLYLSKFNKIDAVSPGKFTQGEIIPNAK